MILLKNEKTQFVAVRKFRAGCSFDHHPSFLYDTQPNEKNEEKSILLQTVEKSTINIVMILP